MIRTLVDAPYFMWGFVLALGLATELGHRMALRARRRTDLETWKGGPMEGAILGLLALLLGFTFGQAGSSYRERTALVHLEADAIGDTFRMSALLPDDERAWLRARLLKYADLKLAEVEAARSGNPRAIATTVRELQDEMWSHLTSRARSSVDAGAARDCLRPLDQLIDLHARRSHTANERVPQVILFMLVVGAILVSVVVGFASGFNEKRFMIVPLAFVVMVSLAFGTIRDLDQPYQGWIQVDTSHLVELRGWMAANQKD